MLILHKYFESEQLSVVLKTRVEIVKAQMSQILFQISQLLCVIKKFGVKRMDAINQTDDLALV